MTASTVAAEMSRQQILQALVCLVIATVVEVSGDALIRKALEGQAFWPRVVLFVAGAALLTAYGTFLNLAPVEFGQVVGLYIATLFVVWQVVTWRFFGTLPTLPVLAGGGLIVAGGLIVTFWSAGG